MAMTERRKKILSKLRRKFKYSTNTNYNRGCIVEKPGQICPCFYSEFGVQYQKVTDFAVVLSNRISEKECIEFHLTKYKDYGESKDGEQYQKVADATVMLSLDELDLIYQLAHEMAEEHDWKGQLKKRLSL